MMYWVVFALFTSAETITDIFLSFWYAFIILVELTSTEFTIINPYLALNLFLF